MMLRCLIEMQIAMMVLIHWQLMTNWLVTIEKRIVKCTMIEHLEHIVYSGSMNHQPMIDSYSEVQLDDMMIQRHKVHLSQSNSMRNQYLN